MLQTELDIISQLDIMIYVIHTFENSTAEDVFNGDNTRAARLLPRSLWDAAVRKLDQLNAAVDLTDLKVPPGNRLKALSGALVGFHSIRINDQYRIVFKWVKGEVFAVKIEDYH